MDNQKIVPFGKYKGKPLEAMAEDREYLDWLLTQSWFRERFESYYTIIINNFGEASETPDHNAMQAEFLSPEFRKAFCFHVCKIEWPEDAGKLTIRYEFEVKGWDVVMMRIPGYVEHFVELKPSMGDDYPAVLRQIKARKEFGSVIVLMVRTYAGAGATLAQVKEIFKNSGIKVVLRSEIEE